MSVIVQFPESVEHSLRDVQRIIYDLSQYYSINSGANCHEDSANLLCLMFQIQTELDRMCVDEFRR